MVDRNNLGRHFEFPHLPKLCCSDKEMKHETCLPPADWYHITRNVLMLLELRHIRILRQHPAPVISQGELSRGSLLRVVFRSDKGADRGLYKIQCLWEGG